MRTSIFASAVLASLCALAACSSNNDTKEKRYCTLRSCVADHAAGEAPGVQDAIVTCCIDHPIGDADDTAAHPSCGQSAADCTDHVNGSFAGPAPASDCTDGVTASPPAVTSGDADAACQAYIAKLAE
ncbi:MAG TPA: hypothetical protein VFP84_36840 [Kofleriaceae bacterium]|nr:hypothetical protein [Kofleriaceae bacterium]